VRNALWVVVITVPVMEDVFTFERLLEICADKSKLEDFLKEFNLLHTFDGRCQRCGVGVLYMRSDKSLCDGKNWRCSNKKCTLKYSIRRDSFFEGSKLSIITILKIVYFWSHGYPLEIVVHESGISAKTIVDFYNLCREVCGVVLKERSQKIGGPGKTVEIDESKFGKRYNKGKRIEGVWVFGGIERDTTPVKCFSETVEDRSAATLIPVIKKWIEPGTTILSDCWKKYSSLEAEGYIHETINHSIEFVRGNGIHTNNIRSRWCALKKSLPQHGTNKKLFKSHFSEYCIRQQYLSGDKDKFLEILKLISTVYHPKNEELLPSSPDDATSFMKLEMDAETCLQV